MLTDEVKVFKDRWAVNLQAVLDNAYDEGGYEELLDYTIPPPGPLTPEDRDWVAAVLASKLHSNGKSA